MTPPQTPAAQTAVLYANQPERWHLLFAHFFTILLAGISVAQWAVPLWFLTTPTFIRPSHVWPIHVLMPLFFFSLNLTLLRFLRRLPHPSPPLRFLVRLYFAYGFTTVFCLIYLLLCVGIWVTLWLICQTLSMAATDLHPTGEPAQAALWQGLYWASASGVGVIVGAFVYGYIYGQRQVHITQLTLPLPNWPEAWQDLKILHLSDLHIGSNLTTAELRNYLARANALAPDLVFLTGDLLDANPAYIAEFFPLLNQLTARYGVFACLGNHDVYAGAQAVAEGLARYTHITLLRDQVVHITVNGLPLHIVGLDDRGKDWARGLSALPLLSQLVATIPADEPSILLSHRPDLFPQAAGEGISLTLSGHTHGGQIALPGWHGRFNLARFITRFPRGLYSDRQSFLYVNSGLGVTGQRVRIFTPRELALLQCRPLGIRHPRKIM